MKKTKTSPKNELAKGEPMDARLLSIELIQVREQYRKSINDAQLKDLAENIKKNGLIHPILVRQTENETFELVSGERRLRASKIAGFAEIMATVRNLSEDEVIDIQLSENLQREDVSPLEEASAFLTLLNQISITDISLKIGKTPKFVAGRLSLNNLIEPLKELLKNESLSIGQAIYLSRQEQANQTIFLESFASNVKSNSWNTREIKHFFERNFETPLVNARFDLESTDLIPSAGACTACQKNTACRLALFNDEEPVCLDRICFAEKTFAHRRLTVLSLPEDIFIVRDNWGEKEDDIRLINEISKHVTVYENEFIDNVIYEVDEFEEAEPILQDFDSEEEFNEEYADYYQMWVDYQESVRKYNEKIKEEDVCKGFLISGRNAGSYIHFYKSKKALQSNGELNPEFVHSEDKAQLELLAQKQTIIAKAQRALELDAEKINSAVVDKLKQIDEFNGQEIVDTNINEDEENLLLVLLFGKMGWNEKREFKQRLGLSDKAEQLFTELVSLDINEKNFIKRQAMRSMFSLFINNLDYYAVHAMAKSYAEKIGLEDIVNAQNEKRDKREARKEERLALIDKQLEDLKAEVVSAEVVTT